MDKQAIPNTNATNDPNIDPQDRAAIVDALYSFGAGQDLRDRSLLESAFSAQAKTRHYKAGTEPWLSSSR